jgi:ribulose-phosphate 3-epimerase
MPEVLAKTKKIKELITKKKLKTEIEIDGGINFENSTLAKKAGANVLVSGSTIFKENQGNLKKNIGILRTNK